ncbi:sigma-70 family RNA polymerase sigma factor [Tsukamurella soli]|uniref:sigma-70 family RNA polymerase sigma factor n=1 Tax=Tsukamurella soli TaxID=644556 RepID=UPI00360E63FF
MIGTPGGAQDEFGRAWHAERIRLVGLANRIVGDRHIAEDAVQEAFARFAAAREVAAPAAWLSAVTARICLDHLKAAATRREHPADSPTVERGLHTAADPADRITLDDSVRAALYVVLDRLTPEERVAFVLHDAFALTFAEIAEITGRSAAATRQQASRARRRLASEPPLRTTDPGRPGDAAVTAFLSACATGDVASLVATLHADAWGRADFTTGAPPIVNRGAVAVATNLRGFLHGAALTAAGHTVYAFDGVRWFATLVLHTRDGLVESIAATVDPTVLGSDRE